MDTAVDTRAQAPRWHDEKPSSPNPTSCDDEINDILLDTYFDHSQPLDNSALDALLETNFDDDDDDDDDESASTKAIAGKWRPAHSGVTSEPQQLSSTKMEPIDYHNGATSFVTLPSSHTYHASQSRMYEVPVNAVSAYHGLPMSMHPPSPYDHQTTAQQSHQSPLGEVRTHFSNGKYFANPSPVALPTMDDLYRDPTSQMQHPDCRSPSNTSCHNSGDLMDYENTIPEDDEAGGNVDPCYAQLLYRCLKEAPDHTMALKSVYEWVLQHSQKARDSPGTGWRNSVRHNLSMNAAFERVKASAVHGPKKCSLWRLTEQALREGHVISTTRYRKDPKRKSERRSSPALKRQISGAKGGQATRAASAHKRAMLARHSGTHNFNSIKQYQRPHHHGAPFFTPNSMPGSSRATASPHPGWVSHGMSQQTSLPPSPYYLPTTETEQYATLPPQSLSNPHTPTEVRVGYAAAPQKILASPSTAFGSPSKGLLTEFELSYHDHAMGSLFGNNDGFEPNTPSLGTEMSFATDEMTPLSMRMSASVEPSRS